MMLAVGSADNGGPHQCRCCCETTVQIYAGDATDSARLSASSSKQFPPRNEQNCFGTATPKAVVVRLCKRVPSPPASTIAQVFSSVRMGPPLRRYRCMIMWRKRRIHISGIYVRGCVAYGNLGCVAHYEDLTYSCIID